MSLSPIQGGNSFLKKQGGEAGDKLLSIQPPLSRGFLLVTCPNQLLKVGEFQSFDQIEDELRDYIKEFDENRFINDWEKIELIKGDACETIPRYIEDNPHTMISLLYLDFDLYEPTKVALEYLAPRVVKGGIIAFDEINAKAWAGETIAALEYFGDFNKCNFRKFPFATGHSYLIVE